jgi:ribonuclease HII
MLKERHSQDAILEAGIDEAGRGCLWGPMVAAACVWPESLSPEDQVLASQINDSKKLSAKKRAALETFIKRVAQWSLGIVEAAEIDRLGMTKSNRLAFHRAFEGLPVKPGRVIVDGILPMNPIQGVEQVVEPKADGTYIAIAAASILAKEGRDRLVKDLCEADPTLQDNYRILSSKGYGTAAHCAGLKAHGMHALHRRLFLRKLLNIDHVCEAGPDFLD